LINNTLIEDMVGVFWGMTIPLSVIGCFVYGGIEELPGLFMVLVLFSLMAMLSFIPFVGVAVSGLMITNIVQPLAFGMTGIYPTWVTLIMLFITIPICGYITLRMTLFTLSGK